MYEILQNRVNSQKSGNWTNTISPSEETTKALIEAINIPEMTPFPGNSTT